MRIQSLKLENFQGIENFELKPDGASLKIGGENGSGKTALANAWSWLMTDKDSLGRSEGWNIKPLTPDGGEIHNLETSVEAVLGFSETETQVVLRKVFSEKWAQRRGTAGKEFTGHVINHFIDAMPVAKHEYEEYICSIVGSAKTFRLLSSPLVFASEKPYGYGWEARRRLLFDFYGEITDAEIIDSNGELAELKKFLLNRPIEEQRKVVESRRKQARTQREEIPIRIKEVLHEKELDLTAEEVASAKTLVKVEAAEIKTLQETRARLEAGGQAAEKKKELAEIEAEIILLQGQYDGQMQVRGAKLRGIETEAKDMTAKMERLVRDGLEIAAKLEELRTDYRGVGNKSLNDDIPCPTCDQPIPMEKKTETKKQLLSKISEKGKALRAEEKTKKEAKEALQKEMSVKLEEIELIGKAIAELPKVPTGLLDRKAAIQKSLNFIKVDFSAVVRDIDKKLEEKQMAVLQASEIISKAKASKISTERIKELKDKEKLYGVELEEIERQLFLMEEFLRTKAKLLDEKINSRFKNICFKLFEVQVNGGLNDCCEITSGGVPFNGGLNNGARINVGLECIDLILSKHFKSEVPVFIDGAESVDNPYRLSAQTILLIDRPGLHKLEVLETI